MRAVGGVVERAVEAFREWGRSRPVVHPARQRDRPLIGRHSPRHGHTLHIPRAQTTHAAISQPQQTHDAPLHQLQRTTQHKTHDTPTTLSPQHTPLSPPNTLSPLYTHQHNAQVNATVSFLNTDKGLVYASCARDFNGRPCQKKLAPQGDGTFHCERCGGVSARGDLLLFFYLRLFAMAFFFRLFAMAFGRKSKAQQTKKGQPATSTPNTATSTP